MGSITPVKVLGILALIDSGETDWKVVVISQYDVLFDLMNDITDVIRIQPNLLEALKFWLENYKITEGKAQNKFAFNGEF